MPGLFCFNRMWFICLKKLGLLCNFMTTSPGSLGSSQQMHECLQLWHTSYLEIVCFWVKQMIFKMQMRWEDISGKKSRQTAKGKYILWTSSSRAFTFPFCLISWILQALASQSLSFPPSTPTPEHHHGTWRKSVKCRKYITRFYVNKYCQFLIFFFFLQCPFSPQLTLQIKARKPLD